MAFTHINGENRLVEHTFATTCATGSAGTASMPTTTPKPSARKACSAAASPVIALPCVLPSQRTAT